MLAKIHKPSLVGLPPLDSLLDDVRHTAKKVIARVQPYITRKHVIIATGASAALLTGTYSVMFFWPQNVAFSYASDTCLTQPVLLPNFASRQKSASYEATPRASVSVANYPLYSQVTCITPTSMPSENKTETINFGSPIFKKNIKVANGTFPSLANEKALDKPIPTQDTLKLELFFH